VSGRGGRGGRGASTSVQVALGWHGGSSAIAHRTEVAPCAQCGSELRFTTGNYGQTLEICTSRKCPGRVPHRPLPDPGAKKPPYVPRARRGREP
jgi:hypothetical protein